MSARQRAAVYPGIDRFRIAACLMVIAVHTGPLGSVSQTADTVVTYIICRLAVPFFFLASGFFLVRAAGRESGARPLAAFLRKTLLLDLAAIAAFLPLNVYSGYFRQEHLAVNLLRDLAFNGTLYHLWYLPAAALGACMAWALLKKTGPGAALAVTGALWIVGLFGDSWYGLTARVPALAAAYGRMFLVFDYTRNGLFFAPLFFVLGGIAAGAEVKRRRGSGKYPVIFAVSMAAMIAEGVLLHRFGLPRHDSMYLFLPPAVYSLFRILLCVRGRAGRPAAVRPDTAGTEISGPTAVSGRDIRRITLFIYLFHPYAIVLVRALAKLTGNRFAVDCTPVLFGLTILFSAAGAMAANRLLRLIARNAGGHGEIGRPVRRDRTSRVTDTGDDAASGGASESTAGADCAAEADAGHGTDRAWIGIDTEALGHNAAALRGMLPAGCALSAVVKANAYGHGLIPVSLAAQEAGVRSFCVASCDEGIALRKAGVRGDVLVLGYTVPERAAELIRYRLTQTLADAEHARALSAEALAVRAAGHMSKTAASRGGMSVRAHLSVDTGMHRLGFSAEDPACAAEVFALPGLRITGIFSHLAVPEGNGPEASAFTDRQADRFDAFLEGLAARKIIDRAAGEHGGYRDASGRPLTIHLQSSYGFLNRPDLTERFHCGLVRTGVALYGVKSSEADRLRLEPGTATGPDLHPVLSFRSRVVSVRTVPAGECVGYGMAFRAGRETRVAAVSAGYADGVPRSLSCGAGRVIIRGRRVPVCGRVCMDMFLADVTDLPDVQPGDAVTLIGRDGPEEITAAEMADAAGTLANDLLSGLGSRPVRICGPAAGPKSPGQKKTEPRPAGRTPAYMTG